MKTSPIGIGIIGSGFARSTQIPGFRNCPGAKIVAIASHRRERAEAVAKEFGIQYPLGKPDGDLVSFLLSDSDAIPQTFVFDRQGQLVQRFVGYGSDTGIYLDGAVETALKTPAP